ncbi:hypothetical protein LTR36_001781 [Oleoguttula mirabilis]|uniref:Uncharacterized protein n=1 Tax=Oleoguttula mirabilis TaxID=1507867 RepID=A0AAV9JNM2_9PEZI|nr:hypothetical protein LTR36_001781 [Oleoguttula mirabilis]
MSSRAVWRRSIVSLVFILSVAILWGLMLKEELRQRVFCRSDYTASLGNAIGPASVACILTTFFFHWLLVLGWLDQHALLRSQGSLPRELAFVIVAAFSVVVSCVTANLNVWAPNFSCGKVNGLTGKAY